MHKRRFVEADCRVSLDHRSQLFEGSLLTRGQQDRPGGGETTTAALDWPCAGNGWAKISTADCNTGRNMRHEETAVIRS